jgi:hypothetical protein
MTDTTPIQTTLDSRIEAKPLAELLPPIVDALPSPTGNCETINPYATKDRSNGNSKHLKPIQKGEVRNPKGNPRIKEIGLANSGMQKIKRVYAEEGYSPDQVARRMTHWLNMPYERAVKTYNNPKTPLFERLGISIIIKATENAEYGKLGNLLDRIIGPVIQHSTQDIRSLTVTAKADADLLRRIQTDLQQGKPLDNKDNTTT